MDNYAEYLDRKSLVVPAAGLETIPDVNPQLYPFQSDIVRWALRHGRACIFADCGLGKTPMQLEWAKHIPGDVLIVAPLAVSLQTQREGEKFGIPVTVCKDAADVRPGVNITNYERFDRFDVPRFTGIVLDESSILKSYDGAFRNAVLDAVAATPYRLACTATPAPNDVMELANHAEYVGAMTRTEMLSMFFVHDGGETQKWRLKGHAKRDFWRWVSSWAVMLRLPSDLGYEDDGFVLPGLEYHEHRVSGEIPDGFLIPIEAVTLQERIAARRTSVEDRVAAVADIINGSPSQWVVWCHLNAESDALVAAIPDAQAVKGADPPDTKVSRMMAFTCGDLRVLVTKPSIAGFGMNWQHCHHVAFVGLSDSWEQWYQAIRRCWRFGQHETVHVHVVAAETEGRVVANIKRKEEQAATVMRELVAHTQEFTRAHLHKQERVMRTDYQHDTTEAKHWTMHLGDCVQVLRDVPSDSIDYSVFSPPFASLYTYTDRVEDMGNCKDHREFMEHFGFLVTELLRVVKPGRLLSFHCMNVPMLKVRDGVIGLTDFRGLLIQAFVDAGWIYHSEVVIWKDPVTAMQRTKALGLLYKQLKKDSTMSRQGIPDYLVTMRKPGENPDPVTKTADSMPVQTWQRYASPVWMDINPSDTLQKASVREDADERHIAPLQLEVIRRAITLWTNPGDLVLSPFAGIGSEGYVAIQERRRFLGVELKESYYRQACANLEAARHIAVDLFDDVNQGVA